MLGNERGRSVLALRVLIRVNSDYGVRFGRPCYEVHGTCDNRINLYPAAPIRLAKVLLAWTIVQAGWGSSF
jgi:hypothetical protein